MTPEYPVYAITQRDGPVVLQTCANEQEQRRVYREARQTLAEGGYDPDVRDIALGPVPAPQTPPEHGYQTLIQGMLNL